MSTSPINASFLYLGSTIGIIQNLIWTVFSFAAISTHFTADAIMKLYYASDSYQQIIKAHWFYIFIKFDSRRSAMVIQPREYLIVMSVYFALSLLWLGLSFHVLFSYKNNANPSRLLKGISFWSLTGALTILFDLIFCGVLARDFSFLVDEFDKLTEVETRLAYSFSITSYGLMFIVASRGLVLWIINLVLVAMFSKMALRLKAFIKADGTNLKRRESNSYQSMRFPETALNLPDGSLRKRV